MAGRSKSYKDQAELRLSLRNQAVLAESAARKLFDLHEGEAPEDPSSLRDLVEKIAHDNPNAITKAEKKALQRMSTLHRWEETADKAKAEEAAADERVTERAIENGLEKVEYLCMVHLMTAKAQNMITDKGMEELQRLLDKSDAYLRVEDKKASDEIAAMRAEMLAGK